MCFKRNTLVYYNKSSSSSVQWRSMLAEVCVCTCFFLCVVVCSVSVAVSQTFCVTHWRWSIYIGRFSLVNSFFFISASCTTILFFPSWVFIYCECIFRSLFFFFEGFVHRKMKERKACNDVAQPTQHCAVVSTPSHTLFVRILPCCDVLALVIVFYSCRHELNCETGSLSSLL